MAPCAQPGKLPSLLLSVNQGHDHTTLKQQLLDSAVTQAKSEVQPYGVADDFHRKPVVLRFDGGGWCIHAAILSYRADARQVDNACRISRITPGLHHIQKSSGCPHPLRYKALVPVSIVCLTHTPGPWL